MPFGQTLAGNGTIAGAVTDGGGSTAINPGVGGAGTLTFSGNLSLVGGSTINFDLTPTPTTGSGVNDLIVVGWPIEHQRRDHLQSRRLDGQWCHLHLDSV
jgi:hypothetical protein